MSKRVGNPRAARHDYVARLREYFGFHLFGLDFYESGGELQVQIEYMDFKHIDTVHHDWGLTIGILRPGSDNASTYEYDFNYDGFGNSRWGLKATDYAVTSDSFDVFGRFLGTNPADSFSLKPRAYKPFRYRYDEQGKVHISTNPNEWSGMEWLIPCNADVRNANGAVVSRIQSRGLCDTFMSEFFYFLLNCQKYRVEALCTVAELADIRSKWLRVWEVNGKIGWIDKVSYSVSVDKGIGKVEIDFFAP